MMTRLYLIRHGATEWTRLHKYCGSTDIALNTAGRRQAEKLYHRMKNKKIDMVYSSDLKRAAGFADIVFKGVPVEKDTRLREIDFGSIEGMTHDEVMNMHKEMYQNWIEDPLHNILPGGESIQELANRVRDVIADIVRHNNGKNVAVCTHGGPIKIVMLDASGRDLKDIWKDCVELAQVTVVEYAPKEYIPKGVLVEWED